MFLPAAVWGLSGRKPEDHPPFSFTVQLSFVMDFKRLSFDDSTDIVPLVWMLSTLEAVDKSSPAFNSVKIQRRGLLWGVSQEQLTRSKTKWGSLIRAFSFDFNRASKEKLASLGNKVSQDLRYAVHSTVWFSWQSFRIGSNCVVLEKTEAFLFWFFPNSIQGSHGVEGLSRNDGT